MKKASTFLSPHPSSVGAARRFVAGKLSAWGCEAHRDDAALLTSELVTNAIKHVGSSVQLRLTVNESVRVEVADTSPEAPRPRSAPPDAETGRGLHLVDAIARSWGTASLAGGRKCVWFEMGG